MPGAELNPNKPPFRPIVHSAQQIGSPINRKEIK